MGLVLDLAIVAVTLIVIASLGLLAWTLAVGATRATAQGRERVAGMRAAIADAEARLGSGTDSHGGATTE